MVEENVHVTNDDALQVCGLWRELANTTEGFCGEGLLIVESEFQRVAPPGWVGIVELGGDIIVVSPGRLRVRVEAALLGCDPSTIFEAGIIERLNPAETRGPAMLFYGAPALTDMPQHGVTIRGPLKTGDDLVTAVVAGASDQELDESGLAETTSGIYVALDGVGRPRAACGWREWPNHVAHISVLSAHSGRRSGYGRSIAIVTLRHAKEGGLLPQWRSAHRNEPSIRLARSIGLTQVGRQVSIRI